MCFYKNLQLIPIDATVTPFYNIKIGIVLECEIDEAKKKTAEGDYDALFIRN